MKAEGFRLILEEILNFQSVPGFGELNVSLENCRKVLDTENSDIRPRDREGRPGGLILLSDKPALLVPDLHARRNFLGKILNWTPPGFSLTVLELLENQEIQLVCLGDGFHSEARGRDRWFRAWDEYQGGFKRRDAMEAEMTEGLGVMMLVMELKATFPENFHFLKGNHENIANESLGGNRPFRKITSEGEMVLFWFQKVYPSETFQNYYHFEKSLPLFALGDRFCALHCEPARHHSRNKIINARFHSGLVYDLNWTGNGEARKNSVALYLEEYFPGDESSLIYGGHRPVSGYYALRAGDRFVQFHNPDLYIVAMPHRYFSGESTNYGITEVR
ncbi:MAG: hypothetical protein JEY99_10395 [Spirochaetales bacterium]|nr:hypothetical protein [Spirochaetales bacterium]